MNNINITIKKCNKNCFQNERCKRLYLKYSAFACLSLNTIHLSLKETKLRNIYETITHETIHLVLDRIINYETCMKLDNTNIWYFIYGIKRYWLKEY